MTYYRWTERADTPMSDWGHAMFADSTRHIEGGGYGDYSWTVDGDELVDITGIMSNITHALTSDYYSGMVTPGMDALIEQVAEDEVGGDADAAIAILVQAFNPSDIVMSADAWDNEDMVYWFEERYLGWFAPAEIKGVTTSDGAVVFDPAIITAA